MRAKGERRIVTCSKCEQSFPAGSAQAHNKRSCGKSDAPSAPRRTRGEVLKQQNFKTKRIQPPISVLAQKVVQALDKSGVPQRTVHPNGTVEWLLNGEWHNPDGPAIEWDNGDEEWFVRGKLHCLSGPARRYADGGKEWWVSGVGTQHPDLCEKAVLPDLTDEEFYELCSHEDYVVRQLAANNLHCPAEWRTVVVIMDD